MKDIDRQKSGGGKKPQEADFSRGMGGTVSELLFGHAWVGF